MTGQVRYVADDPTRQARGEAAEVRHRSMRNGHAEKVMLGGGVHLTEQK